MRIPKLPKFLLKFLSFFFESKFWTSIIRTNIRPKGYPLFDTSKYFAIRSIIKSDPNALYMFVGADDRNLSLILQKKVIKVRWGHSGFLEVGKSGEIYASHVRYSGYKYNSLLKYLKEVDHFAVIKLRFPNALNESIAKARYKKLKNSKIHYSIVYDMQVRDQYKVDPLLWDKDFIAYCSEYQYLVCMGLIDDRWKQGKKQFSPDEVYEGGTVVFED